MGLADMFDRRSVRKKYAKLFDVAFFSSLEAGLLVKGSGLKTAGAAVCIDF